MILVQWRQEANIVIKARLPFVKLGLGTFNFSIGQFLAANDIRERDQIVDGVETIDEVVKCVNFRDNVLLLKKGSQACRIRENEDPYLVRLII